MGIRRHETTNTREAFEIEPFARNKRELLEVRDHSPEEILESTRLPLHSSIAPIRPDASAPEEGHHCVKHLGTITVLADREAWPYLPTHEQ